MTFPCCGTMEHALHDEANARQAGLSIFRLTDLRTGEGRTAGVVVKKSAGDNGILLNCCPWCRQDLRPMLESDSAATVRA